MQSASLGLLRSRSLALSRGAWVGEAVSGSWDLGQLQKLDINSAVPMDQDQDVMFLS